MLIPHPLRSDLRLRSLHQEPGKRSQLWRMTGTGMLCHEGSSPPQSKPAQPRPLDSSLVLDIAGLAAVSDNRWGHLHRPAVTGHRAAILVPLWF